MVKEIRPVVRRAMSALDAFGMTGKPPLHIRRVLAMWPDACELSVDEFDRAVLAFVVRCHACNCPVERVPDPTGDFWRHVDIPDEPHAVEAPEAGSRERVNHPHLHGGDTGEGVAA